ncbi:hypothetical protein PZ938_13800 [Luteipulveratus sp. YIM 133132]|uniref:hypothetical protein n=1 Tax=Luteipulveratus flavus TaxID=3031728 RepID=UPI0023B13A75|nr:hypothetical protein [Luteipulveratus sp. YIM 133132]MDE9366683.1 hypothetical protein [Luteipulveratus sp. YIM 133132]
MAALFVIALVAGIVAAIEHTQRRVRAAGPTPQPGTRDGDRVRADLAALEATPARPVQHRPTGRVHLRPAGFR